MEIISSILKWSFEPDPRDLKHQGILHPIFALFFGVSFNALASYSASKFLMRYDAFKKERLPRWGRIYVKKFLIFYVFFMIISRYLVMG